MSEFNIKSFTFKESTSGIYITLWGNGATIETHLSESDLVRFTEDLFNLVMKGVHFCTDLRCFVCSSYSNGIEVEIGDDDGGNWLSLKDSLDQEQVIDLLQALIDYQCHKGW